MADNPPPNLADILRTLASLAPPQPGQPATAPPAAPPTYADPYPTQQQGVAVPLPPSNDAIQQLLRSLQAPQSAFQYVPPPQQQQQWQPSAAAPMQQQYHPPQQPSHHTPAPRPPSQTKQQPPRRGPDPTTITDWSTGLRHVMRTVATNEKIIGEIKKMIQTQHENETQWFASRKALQMKLETRAINQKRLDDVLRAVGGSATGGSSAAAGAKKGDEALKPPTAEEELKAFDMKVYMAQHQMVKEMQAKLKSLGVPFFGTRMEFIELKGKKGSTEGSADGTAAAESAVAGGIGKDDKDDGGKKKITELELVELQRRMLSMLEDLC